MSEPVGADPAPSAAEVLEVETKRYLREACTTEHWGDDPWDRGTGALLAHGDEHGVIIRPDGTLAPADPPMTTRLPDGRLARLERLRLCSAADEKESLYRLEADRG